MDNLTTIEPLHSSSSVLGVVQNGPIVNDALVIKNRATFENALITWM